MTKNFPITTFLLCDPPTHCTLSHSPLSIDLSSLTLHLKNERIMHSAHLVNEFRVASVAGDAIINATGQRSRSSGF